MFTEELLAQCNKQIKSTSSFWSWHTPLFYKEQPLCPKNNTYWHNLRIHYTFLVGAKFRSHWCVISQVLHTWFCYLFILSFLCNLSFKKEVKYLLISWKHVSIEVGQMQSSGMSSFIPLLRGDHLSNSLIPPRHRKDFHCLEGGNKAVQQFWPPAASPGFRFPDTPLPAQLFYNSQHQDLAQEWHLNRLKVTCSSDGTAKPEMKALRAGNAHQWRFLNATAD